MRQQLEKELERGNSVKQLLDNKYFKEAIDAAEKSILDQMQEVSLRDKEMHTTLIMARKNLHGIVNYLKTVIQTGEFAKVQLEKPNKVRSFFSR